MGKSPFRIIEERKHINIRDSVFQASSDPYLYNKLVNRQENIGLVLIVL
jgi:hypothetical protein